MGGGGGGWLVAHISLSYSRRRARAQSFDSQTVYCNSKWLGTGQHAEGLASICSHPVHHTESPGSVVSV